MGVSHETIFIHINDKTSTILKDEITGFAYLERKYILLSLNAHKHKYMKYVKLS